MFQFDNVFPRCRTYVTEWPAEACKMFLGRKNLYDVYAYSFEEKNGKGYIAFRDRLRFRAARKRSDPIGVYSLHFEEIGGKTRFTVEFERREGFFEDSPCVDYAGMDRFFELKLDARKAWPEEWDLCTVVKKRILSVWKIWNVRN